MDGKVGYWAPYPGVGWTTMAESSTITAGGCSYKQANDDPHSPESIDASIHGWWIKISGTCPSKANVDVYLQAYFCWLYCEWVTVDSGSGDYYPGPGSGKWANARATCATNAWVGWRGYTDVDLIGVNDPGGYTYSPTKNLSCSPPG